MASSTSASHPLAHRSSYQNLRMSTSSPQPSSPSSRAPDESQPILAHADSYSVRPSPLVTGTRLRARSVNAVSDVSQDVSASTAPAWDSPSPPLETLGEADDTRTMSSDGHPSTPPDSDGSSVASTPLETPIHSAWPSESDHHLTKGRPRSRTLDELVELRSGVARKALDRYGLPLYTASDASDRSTSPPSSDVAASSAPRLSSAPPASPYPVYSLNSMLPRLLFLLLSLCVSFIVIVYLVSTVPHLQLPTSVQVVRSQISQLRTYAAHSASAYTHILVVLSITFVWKQAFSIPGSALVNVLMGAIYGTYVATALTCLLTAVGSTVAYALAKLARPVVETYMPRPLAAVQRALDGFLVDGPSNGNPRKASYDRAELTSYLLVARLLPVVPYAALNVASGVLDLPLGPFFWTLVVGSAPYNYVTTSVGDFLSLAAESEDIKSIWSASLLLKLVVVSLVGAVPVLFKGALRSIIASSLGGSAATAEESDLSGPAFDNAGRLGREWVTTAGSHRPSGEYERVPLRDMDIIEDDVVSATRPSRSHCTSASTRRHGSSWKRTLKRVSWKRLSESFTGFDPATLLPSCPSSSSNFPDDRHHHVSSHSSPEAFLRSPTLTVSEGGKFRSEVERDRRVASVVGGKVRSLGDEWVSSSTVLVYDGGVTTGSQTSNDRTSGGGGYVDASNSWGHIRVPPNAARYV